MTKEMTANPMDTTPIPQLVIKRSVPLMVSTLVSSLYGMVDSMFVARISEKALTATTVAFPITLFLFAIAIGTAMGVNSRLSRFLGEGEMKDAKETGWTGIYKDYSIVFNWSVFCIYGSAIITSHRIRQSGNA